MKRHTTLSVLSGTFALALVVQLAPGAAAYPVPVQHAACPGTYVSAPLDLLTGIYARYTSGDEFTQEDTNHNRILCVATVRSLPAGQSLRPIVFTDDNGPTQ